MISMVINTAPRPARPPITIFRIAAYSVVAFPQLLRPSCFPRRIRGGWDSVALIHCARCAIRRATTTDSPLVVYYRPCLPHLTRVTPTKAPGRATNPRPETRLSVDSKTRLRRRLGRASGGSNTPRPGMRRCRTPRPIARAGADAPVHRAASGGAQGRHATADRDDQGRPLQESWAVRDPRKCRAAAAHKAPAFAAQPWPI